MVYKTQLDRFLVWLDEMPTRAHYHRIMRETFGPCWRRMLTGPRLRYLEYSPNDGYDIWMFVIARKDGKRMWFYTTADFTAYRVRSVQDAINTFVEPY